MAVWHRDRQRQRRWRKRKENTSCARKQTEMTGPELKTRRLAKGWSQRELGRLAGLHHRAVQYWEKRAALDPGGHAVGRMAAALGWDLSGELGDQYARARHGVLDAELEMALLREFAPSMPHKLAQRLVAPRARCKARTRIGTHCKALSVPGRRRCKLHGGLSTGPKTAEGRKRIAEAQQRRWSISE